jgi:hypothetical protein
VATIEEALRARLIADTAVVEMVGQRIYPLVAPPKAALPAIVYQRISGMRVATHDGPSELARPRFQFACIGSAYAGAKNLANAVRVALDGYSGTSSEVQVFVVLLENEFDFYTFESDEAASSCTVLVDFIVWHRE